MSLYHRILDCFAKIVSLSLCGITPFVWFGSISSMIMGIISYMWAKRLISKYCGLLLSYDWDISVASPSLESISMVSDYPNFFPTDLPSFLLSDTLNFLLTSSQAPELLLWHTIIWLMSI